MHIRMWLVSTVCISSKCCHCFTHLASGWRKWGQTLQPIMCSSSEMNGTQQRWLVCKRCVLHAMSIEQWTWCSIRRLHRFFVMAANCQMAKCIVGIVYACLRLWQGLTLNLFCAKHRASTLLRNVNSVCLFILIAFTHTIHVRTRFREREREKKNRFALGWHRA